MPAEFQKLNTFAYLDYILLVKKGSKEEHRKHLPKNLTK